MNLIFPRVYLSIASNWAKRGYQRAYKTSLSLYEEHQGNSIDLLFYKVICSARFIIKKSKIILRVNPEDFEYIERLRPEFFARFEELKSITATSDPSITRGGCFLETPYGDVDARVETQLERIYKSLEASFDGK